MNRDQQPPTLADLLAARPDVADIGVAAAIAQMEVAGA